MILPAGDLWTVELPRANFGIIVREGRVIWSAPYGRGWLLGRSLSTAEADIRRQGGRLIRHTTCRIAVSNESR